LPFLPVEVLVRITSFLDGANIFRLFSTCSFFRTFISDNQLWEECCVREFCVRKPTSSWRSEYQARWVAWRNYKAPVVIANENIILTRGERPNFTPIAQHIKTKIRFWPDSYVGLIRTEQPLQMLPFYNETVSYYEITILKFYQGCRLAIGFDTQSSYEYYKLPGTGSATGVGYHSRTNEYLLQGTLTDAGMPNLSPGMVIGCGLDQRLKCAFFTLDGEIKGNLFTNSSWHDLHSTIALVNVGSGTLEIKINFGAELFAFDIWSYMSENPSTNN